MAKICLSCGSEIPQNYVFCGYCGESVDTPLQEYSRTKIIEEDRSSRRLATILFADLTNYTRAAEEIDPEIIFLAIRTVLERIARVIKKYGGRVDRYYGDGFLATFGIPEAIEDDQQRALLASLEMQELMKVHHVDALDELNWDMQLRIGVNVGQVVSGQLDTGGIFDSSVFGHTVNLASRLQASARPGTILVAEQVHRQMRLKFDFRKPVRLKLRGIDNPVVAYELIGKRADPEPMRGLAGRQAPLIGRDQEYELLIDQIEKLVVDRQGLVALITGDAGVGKSRLVEEILLPENQAQFVVRTQSTAFDTTGYGVLREFLSNLAGLSSKEEMDSQKNRLREILLQTSDFSEELGAILEDLAIGKSSHVLIEGDPQGNQRKIVLAFRRLLAHLSKQKPLVIMFDDIQWADPSSLEVISHFVTLTFEMPLALIFIARSEFRERIPDYLKEDHFLARSQFIDIHLETLSYHDCDNLVESILSEVDIPPLLTQIVYKRTAGNPLFVEELLRIFLDNDIIFRKNDEWFLSDLWREFIEKVPETVNGLLLSRYDNQPKNLREILDGASVMGANFHLNLLALILDIPQSDIRGEMADLIEADFIRRSSGVGSPVFSFRHVIMQEAIYETLLLEDRQKIHQRLAEVLIEVGEEFYVDANAVIGHHLDLCGSDDALPYLLDAAAQAADRYANDEAIVYYKRVLGQSQGNGVRKEFIDAAIGLSEINNRIGDSNAVINILQEVRLYTSSYTLSEYRQADIYYQMGLAYYSSGDFSSSLKNLELASSSMKRNTGMSHSYDLTDVEREIGWVLLMDGELDSALRRAQSALHLATIVGSSEAEGSAHKLIASIHFRTGQVIEAIESAEYSLGIREGAGDVWGAASSQTTLGYFYHQIGKWALAERMLRQAIYVQQEVGDYYNLAGSWINLGLLLLDKGQFEESLECMNEAINILTDHEFPISISCKFYFNRGIVLLRSGDAKEAIFDFEKGLNDADTHGLEDLCAFAYAFLAESYLEMKNTDQASQLIQKSLELIQIETSGEIKPDIFRIKSLVLLEEGSFEGAHRENAEARKLMGEIGNQYEHSRLMLDYADIILAEINQGLKYDKKVVEKIEAALDTFTQLGAKADIARGEEILFKIVAQLTDEERISKKIDKYPIVVLDIHLQIPGLVLENLNQVINDKRSILDALKPLAKEENAILNTSQTGFTLVLTNAYQSAIDRMAVRAIEFVQTAIMSCVLLNKKQRRTFSHQVSLKAGISLGSTSELVSNQEQAALFCSVSQPGRQARLMAEIAPEFQILISGDVISDIRHTFELHPFDIAVDRRLPSIIYRIGEMVSQSDMDVVLPQSSSKLIGRETELDVLNGWIKRTKSENVGFIAFIEAEAGMGKTRLLKEILRNSGQECIYLNGKCEAFRSNISYWPLVEILEKYNLPESQEFLRLKSLLGMHLPNSTDENLLENLSSEALRKEVLSNTRDFLVEQAKEKSVFLIFEDIHFIDLSSLDLLDYIISIIKIAPISLLLISRSEMPGPHRSFLKKIARVYPDEYLHVKFSNLGAEATVELVKNLLGTNILPEGLGDLLTDFDGHPLSIEESIRFLIEQRWLLKVGDTWLLTDVSESSRRDMPDNYRDLLLRRLNRLDNESLHVLQGAALLGEVFDLITLNKMISGNRLAQNLTELAEKGWLQKSEDGSPTQYHFNHTLTRESIYSTLVRSKRQVLHQRAGEAIELLYPESQEENLEILAYHFEHSGLQDKTLYYAVRAAEKCARRFALEEGRTYYRKAEEILDQQFQPHSRMSTRVRLGLADVYLGLGEPVQVLKVIQKMVAVTDQLSEAIHAASLRRWGAALHMQGDLISAKDKYDQAWKMISSTRDREMKSGGRTVISGDEERIEIQIGLARIYFDMHHHQDAKGQAQDALDSFAHDLSPSRAGRLMNLLAGIFFREGNVEKAIKLSKQALSIYQNNGFRAGASDTYSNLGIIASSRQDFNVARENFELALELHDGLGDIEGVAITRNNLGQLETASGNLEAAIFNFDKSTHFARLSELSRTLTQGMVNKGYAYVLLNAGEKALAVLSEAETLCRTHLYGDLLGEVLWKKAEGLLVVEDVNAAIEIALNALDQAGELNRRDIEAQALRVYARGLRKRGDKIDSRNIAREAWQLVEKDRDRQKRAQFALDYALSLSENNQHAEADDLVAKHVQGVRLIEPEHIHKEISSTFGNLNEFDNGFMAN